ncbi:MAG: hypothetical protein AVDCRST_MAG03-4026 [uncultured Rubrobacteraceae bacterium]|uniref:Uncharacterized protein n=1 Tax=uncultured Rubrobacteraceae bacterium TaxID=349277 RepID=A0A6J4QIH1_9ACTN|nr:MAG: hypothetical protein AVDCRST_MAG03-4026 [uncultured Rubrobacteraceae bacterium]
MARSGFALGVEAEDAGGGCAKAGSRKRRGGGLRTFSGRRPVLESVEE